MKKRNIVIILMIAVLAVGGICAGPALASSWSDGFLSFMNITQHYSQFDKSSGEWVSCLSLCDDQLMFFIVVNAGSNNRDILQIFFIGSGNTVDLSFITDEKTNYQLTLVNIDGEYSYHTIFKNEVPLVKALGAANKIKIQYATDGTAKEYELSADEISAVNLLFGFLDERDFTSAVASSYVEICNANSLLYPMTVSEEDSGPAVPEMNSSEPSSGAYDDAYFDLIESYLIKYQIPYESLGIFSVTPKESLRYKITFCFVPTYSITVIGEERCEWFSIEKEDLKRFLLIMLTYIDELETQLPAGAAMKYTIKWNSESNDIIELNGKNLNIDIPWLLGL